MSVSSSEKAMSIVESRGQQGPGSILSVTMEDLTSNADGMQSDFENTGLNSTSRESLATVLGNLQISVRNFPDGEDIKVDGNLLHLEIRSKIKAYESALLAGPFITALDKEVASLIAYYCAKAKDEVPTGVGINRPKDSESSERVVGSNETTASLALARANRKHLGDLRLPTSAEKGYTMNDFDYRADLYTFGLTFTHSFLSILSTRFELWNPSGRDKVLEELWTDVFNDESHIERMTWKEWCECCKALSMDNMKIFFKAIFVYAKLNVSEELEKLRKAGLPRAFRKAYLQEMLDDTTGANLICQPFTNQYLSELKKVRAGSSSIQQAASGSPDATGTERNIGDPFVQPFIRDVILRTYAAALRLINHAATDKVEKTLNTCKSLFSENQRYVDAFGSKEHFEQQKTGLLAVVTAAVDTAYRLYLTHDGTVSANPSDHFFDFDDQTETISATRAKNYMLNIYGLNAYQWHLIGIGGQALMETNKPVVALEQYNQIGDLNLLWQGPAPPNVTGNFERYSVGQRALNLQMGHA